MSSLRNEAVRIAFGGLLEGRPSQNERTVWGFPKIRGTFLGGPHNKDYSIWGSILGSPYLCMQSQDTPGESSARETTVRGDQSSKQESVPGYR